MITPGKEMFYVTAYDHRNNSHDRGTFETEALAHAEAVRIKKMSVPTTFYCVCVGVVKNGFRQGLGPV